MTYETYPWPLISHWSFILIVQLSYLHSAITCTSPHTVQNHSIWYNAEAAASPTLWSSALPQMSLPLLFTFATTDSLLYNYSHRHHCKLLYLLLYYYTVNKLNLSDSRFQVTPSFELIKLKLCYGLWQNEWNDTAMWRQDRPVQALQCALRWWASISCYHPWQNSCSQSTEYQQDHQKQSISHPTSHLTNIQINSINALIFTNETI